MPRPLTRDDDLTAPKVLLPPKAVEAFSGPLSELLRNLAALSSCSLAPMAKTHAESAAKSGEALMALAQRFGIANPDSQAPGREDRRPFDIYKMLNELHEENLSLAQDKGLGLSWFASPRLSHRFEGDGLRLKAILEALLRDSIQSSSSGSVQFSARLTADSNDPGMVTFTISDSRPFSSRYDPSANQASLEAIRFANALGGAFNTSNNQQNGTVVSFSAHFTPLSVPAKNLADSKISENKAAQPATPSLAQAVEQVINLKKPVKPLYTPTRFSHKVLVLDMAVGTRRQLLSLLNQLGIRGQELRFAPEALDFYAQEPTPLVTVNADMPESDLALFVNNLKELEKQNDLGPVKVLAVAGNAAQSQRLLSLGCNRVVLKPLTLENIREAINTLSPELLKPMAPASSAGPPQAEATRKASGKTFEQVEQVESATFRTDNRPDKRTDNFMPDQADEPERRLAQPVAPGLSAPLPGTNADAAIRRSMPEQSPVEPPIEPSVVPPVEPAGDLSAEKAASLEFINSVMANPIMPDKNSVLALNSLPVTEIRPRPRPPMAQEPMARLLPVPGLDYEGIEPELVPLLPGFIADVREALAHAAQARDRQSTIDVQEAVTRLAGKAQSFGLSKLEGIAACVARAAAADDIAAVSDLMLELDNTTSKHIEALRNFYDAEWSKPASQD